MKKIALVVGTRLGLVKSFVDVFKWGGWEASYCTRASLVLEKMGKMERCRPDIVIFAGSLQVESKLEELAGREVNLPEAPYVMGEVLLKKYPGWPLFFLGEPQVQAATRFLEETGKDAIFLRLSGNSYTDVKAVVNLFEKERNLNQS